MEYSVHVSDEGVGCTSTHKGHSCLHMKMRCVRMELCPTRYTQHTIRIAKRSGAASKMKKKTRRCNKMIYNFITRS